MRQRTRRIKSQGVYEAARLAFSGTMARRGHAAGVAVTGVDEVPHAARVTRTTPASKESQLTASFTGEAAVMQRHRFNGCH